MVHRGPYLEEVLVPPGTYMQRGLDLVTAAYPKLSMEFVWKLLDGWFHIPRLLGDYDLMNKPWPTIFLSGTGNQNPNRISR